MDSSTSIQYTINLHLEILHSDVHLEGTVQFNKLLIKSSVNKYNELLFTWSCTCTHTHALTYTHSLSHPPDKHTTQTHMYTHTLPLFQIHTRNLSLSPQTNTLSLFLSLLNTHTNICNTQHRVTCSLSCTLGHTWEESCLHYLHMYV